MDKNFAFQFDDSTGILYKHYFGSIKFEDIFSSWDYAIENNIIPDGTKSFILDYREATFDINIKETDKIAKYYFEHLSVFRNCKIAIITQNPKDVVIPALVETKDHGYKSKPFYTVEAAIDWVLK